MNEEFSATKALTDILTESIKEQKRIKRWKAVTRGLSLVFFLFVFFFIFRSGGVTAVDTAQPHTALIQIKGMIAEDSFYGSAEQVVKSLQKAFKQEHVKGVILDLNSPGGSPVQSDIIYAEIKRLQAEDKQNRKVYSVVSDVCASGCYYLASASEDIYANQLSTVGSIGVLFSSFGAVDLMKKVGIDRRLQTAGKYKAFLDPFSPETEESKKIIQEHLQIVHDFFIDRVKEGRSGRLLADENPDIFSGLFWTGVQAADLGLIDGFKTKLDVAKDIIKAEKIVDYTAMPNIGDVLVGNFSQASSQISMLDYMNSFNNRVSLIN